MISGMQKKRCKCAVFSLVFTKCVLVRCALIHVNMHILYCVVDSFLTMSGSGHSKLFQL